MEYFVVMMSVFSMADLVAEIRAFERVVRAWWEERVYERVRIDDLLEQTYDRMNAVDDQISDQREHRRMMDLLGLCQRRLMEARTFLNGLGDDHPDWPDEGYESGN